MPTGNTCRIPSDIAHTAGTQRPGRGTIDEFRKDPGLPRQTQIPAKPTGLRSFVSVTLFPWPPVSTEPAEALLK